MTALLLFFSVGGSLTIAQTSGPEVSFCPAGTGSDGFIDWSKLPKNPVYQATIPVSGVNNLSVTMVIHGQPPDPIESPYGVSNPATLGIPFGVGPVFLFFSRPIRGISATLQAAGYGGRQFDILAFSSNEDAIGNNPAAQVTTGGPDYPASQYSTSPLEVRSTSANLSAVELRFSTGANSNYVYYNLVNIRIDSGSVPDPANQLPRNGLKEWLRADRVNITTEPVIALGNVIRWPDQSGNGSDAVPPNPSLAPISFKDGSHCKPVVSFNGVQRLGFNLSINGWTGMTVFMASQAYADASSSGTNQALLWNQTATGGVTFFTPSQTHTYFRFGTTQTNNQPVYTRPFNIGGDFSVTTAIHNGSTDSLYVNGLLVLQQGGKLSSIAGTSASAIIGAGLSNTSFTGNIGEILVYDRVLTRQEQETVEHYLMSKYGVE
ncbi:MAG TPA: LamG-like jellyroll fold domain-containing protein [Bryobacteraceae bacterium]|jgi:hypothetical protein